MLSLQVSIVHTTVRHTNQGKHHRHSTRSQLSFKLTSVMNQTRQLILPSRAPIHHTQKPYNVNMKFPTVIIHTLNLGSGSAACPATAKHIQLTSPHSSVSRSLFFYSLIHSPCLSTSQVPAGHLKMQIRFQTPVRLLSHYQARQRVNSLIPIYNMLMKALCPELTARSISIRAGTVTEGFVLGKFYEYRTIRDFDRVL